MVGDLGYDFAGALHRRGDFRSVFVAAGPSVVGGGGVRVAGGAGFVDVSGLRAGDVRVSWIPAADGRALVFLVRREGDQG
ncbi:hypothetical protein, partial [Saccharothrix syringae]|uniref:hypothetical protein n=1 Tax=Saccharothrix syringae TaxID=103733 RepID=UPI001B805681